MQVCRVGGLSGAGGGCRQEGPSGWGNGTKPSSQDGAQPCPLSSDRDLHVSCTLTAQGPEDTGAGGAAQPCPCSDPAPNPLKGLLLRLQGRGPHADGAAPPRVGAQRLPLRQRAVGHDVSLHRLHLRGVAAVSAGGARGPSVPPDLPPPTHTPEGSAQPAPGSDGLDQACQTRGPRAACLVHLAPC